MTKRIGFCCKWVHPNRDLSKKELIMCESPMNAKGTTVRWLNENKHDAEDKLQFLLEHNINSIKELITQVAELPAERRMCRISSPILPVATQDDWRYYWEKPDVIAYCEKHFGEAGDLAREKDVKISFHPGQFTVLASENPNIVERSIDEFEYHVNMARWMGFGKTFQDGCKINVHISGKQGPAGIKAVLPRLSPEARNLITIENDENSWGLDASLELEKDVALVLDIHHHWIRDEEYIQPTDDRVKRVIDSWRGKRPTLHYSYSRDEWLEPVGAEKHAKLHDIQDLLALGCKKQKLRAHSDFYPNQAANDWALSFWNDFDIQCESKMKNLAQEQLYNRAVELNLT